MCIVIVFKSEEIIKCAREALRIVRTSSIHI